MPRGLLMLLLWTPLALAADQEPVPVIGCPIPALPPLVGEPVDWSGDEADGSDRIDVTTRSVELNLDGPIIFDQRLLIRRGETRLGADSARFEPDTGEFSIAGNVELRDPRLAVRGDAARYNSNTGLFRMDGTEFDLLSVPARGSAGTLSLQAEQILSFEDVTYTTCARGKDDWLLRAGKLTVDRETGVATARNARLEFKGVPIAYVPYVTYPVDGRRKSGLLLPDVGNSDQRGLEFLQPYYFNLAPNYDATLAPYYMSKRGLQARGEFRYLAGDTGGVLAGEFLPDDDVTGDNRSFVSWFNQSLLPGRWRGTVDITDVSDGAYFEDLTRGLTNTSQTHLQRRGELEFFNNVWRARLRIEDYQTLNEAILAEDEPYRRLPELLVGGFWPGAPLGLELGVHSEITYFDRDEGVTGLRAHINPELTLPLQLGPVFVAPTVALDHTAYNLRDTGPGADDTPSRTAPIYSVDLRTVLERSWGAGASWLQTIEPRVQYVQIPFRDQSDLPVFDTIEPDFNLVQLFRRNRYVGLDRLSDTNQLSVGLTTRLIRARDGSQFLTATVGETQYFSSREVVLPGELPSEDSASDYVAELGMNINDQWNLQLGYQWDSDERVTELGEARLLYRPDDYRILNFSYRYRRDSLREIDIAGAWPLTKNLSIVGRFDYSLLDRQVLERFVGLEYSTCCWGVRLIARRNLTSRDGDSDSSVNVQLLLKGFGSSGSPAERLLERGILGYDRFDRY